MASSSDDHVSGSSSGDDRDAPSGESTKKRRLVYMKKVTLARQQGRKFDVST